MLKTCGYFLYEANFQSKRDRTFVDMVACMGLHVLSCFKLFLFCLTECCIGKANAFMEGGGPLKTCREFRIKRNVARVDF